MWEWNLHRWHRSCCANPHTTFCMNHVNSLFYAMFYHHRVIHMLNPENLWFYKHYLNGSMWPQTVRWAAIDVYLAKPLRGFKQDLITPATTPDPLLHLCCSYTITSHKESISPCSQCRGEGPTDALGIKEFKKKKKKKKTAIVTCECHNADCFPSSLMPIYLTKPWFDLWPTHSKFDFCYCKHLVSGSSFLGETSTTQGVMCFV